MSVTDLGMEIFITECLTKVLMLMLILISTMHN